MGIDTKPNFSCTKFEQCTNDVMNLSGCTQIYGTFDMESGSTLCSCAGSSVILSGQIKANALSGKTNQTKIVYLTNDGIFLSGTTASELKVYYVDANNNDNGEGTVTNPYKTIDLAVAAVVGSGSNASPENEGMTIFVQGGTYSTACNLAINCTSWSFEGGSCVTYTGTDYLFQGTGLSTASGTNFVKVSGKGEFYTATGGIISAIGTDTTQGAGQVRLICFEANRIYSTYANYSDPLAKPIVYVAGGTSASGWNSLSTGLILEVDSVAGYSQTPFYSNYHSYFAVCNTCFGLGSSAQSAVSVDGRLIDIDGVYAGRFENVSLSAYDVDYMVELGISGTTLEAVSLSLNNITYSTTKAVSGRRPDKFMAISPLALETSQSFAPDISEFAISNISGFGTWFTDCTQSIDYQGNGTYPILETLRIQNVQTPYGIDACIKPNICNMVNGVTACVYSGGTYNTFGERFTLSNIRECSGSEKALYIDTSGQVLQGAASGGGTASSGRNVTLEVTQSSHGFALNDFIGWSGSTYNKAIADGLYDGEFIGIITEVPDGNNFKVTQSGYVTGLTSSFIANTTYFLSEATPGLLTSTEPTGEGEISKAAFIADTTTSGWVLPYVGYIITTGATTISTANNGLTVNGGIVGLGGTLCQNTDIDVSGFNLSISGLSGKTTQQKTLFVDDVTGTLVTGATTSGCGLYSSNSPATCTVGGIVATTVLTGLTLEYLLQEILAPYIEPAFSSFAVNITSPTEVGTVVSGTKSFTWATSTCDNVATNSIGICNTTSGITLATGLANDYAENLSIGTLTNAGPQTWTWQITGCSTQDTAFNRSVSKCSVYPYFYGVETCGARPAVNNTLVNGGTKCVLAVGSSVSVIYNSSSEWTWFAMPSGCTSRSKWFQGAAPNCGDIAVLPTDKYPDEQCILVSDGGGCWSDVGYKVYMSGSAATDGSTPIQFRTS